MKVYVEEPPVKKGSRAQIAQALKEASAYAFFRYNYSIAFEVGLQAWGSRRADVIGNKINGDLVIIEVKSSVADFRSDGKWHEYLKYADRVYLAFDKATARKIRDNPELKARIPDRVGVMILEPYGYMRVIKPAKRVSVDPALRLSILARLAWRAGELSKRLGRARKRVYIGDPPNPSTLPKKVRKVRKRRRRYRKAKL
jgi:hypothetical protein